MNYEPSTFNFQPLFFTSFHYFWSMKTVFLLITLCITTALPAQLKQHYFTWDWQPCELSEASFASNIKKTDSGYQRTDFFLATHQAQMLGLYEDAGTEIKNGFFAFYYSNGMLEKTGAFKNNKREGNWLAYYRDGSLKDSAHYRDGQVTGTAFSWHQDGYIADSVVHFPGGAALSVSWYDDGQPSAAGHLLNGALQGPWQYFHQNGNIAAKEVYDSGRLVSRTYFNEQGIAERDTANKDRDPEFPGGEKAWEKFVQKNLQFPKGYQITNANKVTILASALIDAEGNVTNPVIEIPFEKNFEANVMAMIKKSPRWLPAISHNRKVKGKITLPLTFGNGESHYYFIFNF